MKIAFTSCMDTVNDSEQKAWRSLQAMNPDEIVLLGDSIYMDYGLGSGHAGNGEPRRLSPAEFSARMYQRYRAQWQVESFRRAIEGRCVRSIWDDHDYGWDNSRGAGADTRGELVPRPLQRLAREQFGVWNAALANPAKGDYPADPCPNGTVPNTPQPASIASTVRLRQDVMLHLTDGRTFREQEGGTLLGTHQRADLDQALAENVIHIIASGSVLATWSAYSDIEWLCKWSMSRRLLVLSGDIHRPDFRAQKVGRIFEAIASAMAQTSLQPLVFWKKRGVFGLLTIDDRMICVELFKDHRKLREHRIACDSWSLQ